MAFGSSHKPEMETSVTETQTMDTEFSFPSSDVIIIDCGSSACKAGFSGEDRHRISIPTVVGTSKREGVISVRSNKDSYVGFEAQQRRAVLKLRHPIERGIITDWDNIETYFEYIFREGLQVDPSSFGILLTEMLNNPPVNREKLVEYLKEELCYVAFDYREEEDKIGQTRKTFRLPDGNVLNLGNELFRCSEALFEPTMLNLKTGGIHENVYRAIQLPDPTIRNLLYSHIVLSGGNTLLSGFQYRLAKEMSFLSEPESIVRIHAKSARKHSVFRGASLISSLTKFKEMLITYPEYYETGPSIVNRKCF